MDTPSNRQEALEFMTQCRLHIEPKLNEKIAQLEYVVSPEIFAILIGMPGHCDDPANRRYGASISEAGIEHDGFPVRVKWDIDNDCDVYFGERLKG